jgi:hypothetical protein
MLGTGEVVPVGGAYELRLNGLFLAEIDGVSDTEIEGIGGAGVVLERAGAESDTLIVGRGAGEGRVGMLAFLSELVSGRGFAWAGGSS